MVSARILLAEDHAINRDLIVAMLARAGHRVDAVATGREAFEAVRSRRYDVVLMDMHMPEIDGSAALAAIREQGGAVAAMTVVALTAAARPEERSRHLAAGFDAYLTKPIDWPELESVMQDLIAGRGQTIRAEAAPPAERDLPAGLMASLGASPLVDSAKIDELRNILGAERLDSMMRMLIASIRKDLDPMQTALRDGDRDRSRELSHALRGAAANLGAVRIAAVARAIETSTDSSAAALCPILAQEAAAIEAWLGEINPRLAATG